MSNLPRSNGVLGEAGFGAFSLIRLLVIVVVLMMLVGSAGQCAQRAPQLAGNAAAGLGQAAATGVASLLSAATSAAYCALPLVDCSANNSAEAFAQCFASTGRPSPRCIAYSSVDEAATAALALARLGTKCSGREFVGLIYTHNVGGIARFSFVGPFVGNPESADLGLAFQVLAKLGLQTSEAMYHSHPENANARFSFADMETSVKLQKPNYVVGTNTLGDGEVRKFTPNKTPLPQGWNTGPAPGSYIDGFLYNWLSWKEIQEEWYDWFASGVGDTVYLGDLGSAGELVDRPRQCPTSVY